MCSAPAAVTRRCPFPASSSLNPAESANRATAACTPAAPALIWNSINPSLPRQIKVPAWKPWGSSRCRLFPNRDADSGWAEAGRTQEPCTLEAGAWNTARRTDLEDVPLDCGILLFQLFPFPFCPTCVYVSTRVCVCIYNNIYMFVCLLEDCGSGKGSGARTRFPFSI